VTIPLHGGREIGPPLFHKILRQLGVSSEEFERTPLPKKGDEHWVDGRSAKELAKAWFRGGTLTVPEELLAALHSHDLTRNLVLERGWAEKVTE
jgi:hypothetical protein